MSGQTRTTVVAAGFVLASLTVASATDIAPATLKGWAHYIADVEARQAHEIAGDAFLTIDASQRADDRRRVMAGALIATAVAAPDSNGRALLVPDGLVHDWRGDVLIPRARLAAVIDTLAHEPPPAPPNDVLSSRLIGSGPGWNRIALVVQRRKVMTVVYATEHLVTFTQYGPDRATSTSIATRITELDNYGTPRQREVRSGDDHGFLWQWHAYWRFEQTAAGVIAECESVSLSRDIPSLVRFVAGPLIRDAARESMTSALDAMRSAFAGKADLRGFVAKEE